MNHIFVLEGPDGAGKSTLADSIDLDIRLVDPQSIVARMHFGAPKEHPFVEYMRHLTAWLDNVSGLPREHRYLIIDRFHLGENVYGTALRDNPIMTYSQLKAIDDLLDHLGAVKIFVDAPNEELERRLLVRGDDIFTEDKMPLMRNIADYWRELVARFDGWHVYDTTKPETMRSFL